MEYRLHLRNGLVLYDTLPAIIEFAISEGYFHKDRNIVGLLEQREISEFLGTPWSPATVETTRTIPTPNCPDTLVIVDSKVIAGFFHAVEYLMNQGFTAMDARQYIYAL